MSWRTEADRMWRDPEDRREFESETGREPLATDDAALELQKASGYVDAYQSAFVEWARRRIEDEPFGGRGCGRRDCPTCV